MNTKNKRVMATAFMDKQIKQLIKRLHVLSGEAGMDREAYRMFLWDNYQVTSSKELNVYELTEACNELDKIANPKTAAMDKERKRVMASIGGYLKIIGATGNDDEYIKSIACRSAKCEYFNRIPLEKLRAVYNTFKNKQEVAKNATMVIEEMVNRVKCLN